MIFRKYLIFILFYPSLIVYSQAENDHKLSFYFYTESELVNSYIFRGIVLQDNYSLQPAVYGWAGNESSWGLIGAGIWLNVQMPGKKITSYEQDEGTILNNTVNITPGINESDFYLMHEFYRKNLTIRNSLALYTFSESTGYPNTTEYILNLTYSIKNFSLFTEFGCDISAYPGACVFTHGAGYDKKLFKNFYCGTSVNLIWGNPKYNSVNAGIEKTAVNSGGLEAYISYTPPKGIYLKAHFQYNRRLNSEIKEMLGDHSSYFGILGGYTF